MFKRLWHDGYKGRLAAFRWDTVAQSAFSPAGEFNRSEHRAFVYGAALKNYVAVLSATHTISLIAHSMGNVVSAEALRQGMQLRNYVLMQAAIPMNCFDANAPAWPPLVTQDQLYPTPADHVDTSTGNLTLGYGGYLTTVAANSVNFYNPADFALVTGTFGGVRTNWEANQERYKPDGAIPYWPHDPSWSYHYDSSYPLHQRAWVVSVAARYVTHSGEMKAFVARSRTQAVGAYDYSTAPFGARVNLGDYGFGDTLSDHSGQFTRSIQQVSVLYNSIRSTLEQ